jgi:hypothetical protein
MTTYELAQHYPSGEVYLLVMDTARETEQAELQGIAGPLHYSDHAAARQGDVDYDSGPETIEWARAQTWVPVEELLS